MNSDEFVKLTIENKKLKEKIKQIYKDWLFDADRYQELKESYNDLKSQYEKLNEKYMDLLEENKYKTI